MKLFISYRSLDSAKVDSIATKLKAIEENGQRIYSVWQDKHNIPDGHNWWEAIVDAIIACDVFIFMVSKESCTSPICQAEVRYAFLRNRPIVPIVLEGEYFYNPQTAKNDLRFWDVIPSELNERNAQFLFYEGGSFAQRLANAIKEFQNEPHRWKDKQAKRPIHPRNKDDVFDIYKVAVECAYRKELETAEQLFLRLMNSADDTFHDEADKWVDIVRAYHDIKKFASHKSTEHRLAKEWTKYHETHFPVDFIDGIFDPFDIAARVAYVPAKINDKPLKITSLKADIKTILPAPFDWIEIPAGKVLLLNKWHEQEKAYLQQGAEQTFEIPAFTIAKYPVTNAQFAEFIAAKGYENKDWWSPSGWAIRKEKNWTEPRYWQKETWNGAIQPVVGVSWYEAFAFCLWLSHETGDTVMLPTEQQWQRAAQALPDGQDSGYVYPWGDNWDRSRCCNSFESVGMAKKTSPVTEFEGEHMGNSPCGVVDMVGNVSEWCLTAYKSINKKFAKTDIHVLCGGSWFNVNPSKFRLDYRNGSFPNLRVNRWGFRFVRNF